MNNRFYNVKCILKYRQKSDSFAAHYEQHFEYTTACKLSTYMYEIKITQIYQLYLINGVIYQS